MQPDLALSKFVPHSELVVERREVPSPRRSEVMVDAATGEVMGVDDDRDEREYYRIGAD